VYDATTYTQFATWAAQTIRCRSLVYRNSKRVRRLFEALATRANRDVAVWSIRPVGVPQANTRTGGVSRFLLPTCIFPSVAPTRSVVATRTVSSSAY